jgi:hypothetical protein
VRISSTNASNDCLLKTWAEVTDVNVEETDQIISSEIAQRAFQGDNFLIATAVLLDQSPVGSEAYTFASSIFAAVEQYIRDSLAAAERELNDFQSQSPIKFEGREPNWIRFLGGATVSGFRYGNGQAFRRDSDGNLESHHDYVQIVFTNMAQSQYANQDLYISPKAETWKAMLRNCPMIKRNIKLNMSLNAIRMLHFWKFHFAFEGKKVVLVDNSGSPLHSQSDHNTLRATRFLEALRLLECGGILNAFQYLLETNYRPHSSYNYWSAQWTKSDHL